MLIRSTSRTRSNQKHLLFSSEVKRNVEHTRTHSAIIYELNVLPDVSF